MINCPICDSGHISKKVYHIPLKDGNGCFLYKSLRVVEGSKIYNQLLNGGTKIPSSLVIIETKQ